MTADAQTFGFPAGYFVIRSVATMRLWDVQNDDVEDSTEILLWPEKEKSLVEGTNARSLSKLFFLTRFQRSKDAGSQQPGKSKNLCAFMRKTRN